MPFQGRAGGRSQGIKGTHPAVSPAGCSAEVPGAPGAARPLHRAAQNVANSTDAALVTQSAVLSGGCESPNGGVLLCV